MKRPPLFANQTGIFTGFGVFGGTLTSEGKADAICFPSVGSLIRCIGGVRKNGLTRSCNGQEPVLPIRPEVAPAIVSGKLLERLDFDQNQDDSNYGMQLSVVTHKQE